jgi:hypothetical protein
MVKNAITLKRFPNRFTFPSVNRTFLNELAGISLG